MKLWDDYINKRVMIKDGSEADGDVGIFDHVQNGVGIVVLDEGCLWPVLSPLELQLLSDPI